MKLGKIETEITLRNERRMENAKEGLIPRSEVQQVTVKAVVDTRMNTLYISEGLRQQLGLSIRGKKRLIFADGIARECFETEAVEICWKERDYSVRAVAIPGINFTLLGQIPLMGMDLIVNSKRKEVVGAHGDIVLMESFTVM